jgi:PAS domain S-box-containing protein
MERDPYPYRILIVEDNPGDFTLIEDFLYEQILTPTILHASTFKDAYSCLSQPSVALDVVFLDISLPDKSGEELIAAMLAQSVGIPIIALTGYADLSFGIKSLSMGISDYLIKDDLSSFHLYKSLVYNIERKKKTQAIEDSERRYSELFHLNPQPMWVYDRQTLQLLNVNAAAIQHYGYTKAEFLAMKLDDLHTSEVSYPLAQYRDHDKEAAMLSQYGVFRHYKKNRKIIDVETQTSYLVYQGRPAALMLAIDVTERNQYIEAIERQNMRLRDIAWIQSHVVRAPLARMMGLIQLLELFDDLEMSEQEILKLITESAHELDHIIQDIVAKSSKVMPS